MSIATLNHWQVLDQLQHDALRRHSGNRSSESNATNNSRRWHPALDISESVNAYHIQMDIPGIKAENVTIEIENNQLKITGERTRPVQDAVKTHHSERMVGKFSRQFQLPKDADATQIHASFAHGVLSIDINKQEESKPRKVTISVKE